MESQRLPSSQTDLPEKFKPKYVIKRIDEKDILISLEARDTILKELQKGVRFVLVRDHILMLHAIKSIDPYWGEGNTPPRPTPQYRYSLKDYPADHQLQKLLNQEELDEWDKYFGSREEELSII